MANFKIKTPHAAVIVWNYVDRISADGVTYLNTVEPKIISTVSCMSIQIAKSKSNPSGTFEIVLAPSKNWLSTLTTGSWCCILMSNRKITEEDIKKAKPDTLKMIGKIESVRLETKQNGDVRQTRYIVTGVDWGHIFNNNIYIDNLIGAQQEQNQQNALAIAIRNASTANGNSPKSFSVDANIQNIISIFGQSFKALKETGESIGRLDKSSYNFSIPGDMADFLGLVNAQKEKNKDVNINNILRLVSGKLISEDKYDGESRAQGFLDPFGMQGTNTFWQILQDNSNPVINEMFNEMAWIPEKGLSLTLFNRIKPFSYKNDYYTETEDLFSEFKYIKTHKIDPINVISISAATNWRDKYNFIEIRPSFPDFKILDNWIKQKVQEFDSEAFEREGFRPLIASTKQFPVKKQGKSFTFDPDAIKTWTLLLRDWYFDSHRLLNGTITMTGTTEYIGVGNNVMIEAGAINPSLNFTSSVRKSKNKVYLLAHVENVSSSFSVDENGGREYITNIQFVRGIFVDENKKLIGDGSLDQMSDELTSEDDVNSVNVVKKTNVEDLEK
jgi:hypothetical protein